MSEKQDKAERIGERPIGSPHLSAGFLAEGAPLHIFLRRAELGSLPVCAGCPRNPKVDKSARFARSCPECMGGIGSPVMMVMRDPGARAGGASQTGKVCMYCNYDLTARNLRRYFEAVGLHKTLTAKKAYLTNAVLHGLADENRNPPSAAYRCCSEVLRAQIEVVRPRLILALGVDALRSLMVLMPSPLAPLPQEAGEGKLIMREAAGKIFDGPCGAKVFAMYHPGGQGTATAGGTEAQIGLWRKALRMMERVGII